MYKKLFYGYISIIKRFMKETWKKKKTNIKTLNFVLNVTFVSMKLSIN